MKLVTTLLLVTFSFFAASAQDIELVNELHSTPITIENISVSSINEVQLLEFKVDTNTITRKKSYKYIIENTLSGRKNLIFKTKRGIKTC
ncbi:hypothetical protein [Lacinutrix himadriensis]|uniref:hypothetical protein n=1 Tax=Lacinutrix himadriensis TaxID=641549 RepID=UPI0006E3EECC|nr:hypothetical protein [Lacinutrix himadriensis]